MSVRSFAIEFAYEWGAKSVILSSFFFLTLKYVLILSVYRAVYRSHSRVYTSIQRDPDEGVLRLHCRHFAHMQYNIQQVRIKVQLYLFYLHLGTQSTDLKYSAVPAFRLIVPVHKST